MVGCELEVRAPVDLPHAIIADDESETETSSVPTTGPKSMPDTKMNIRADLSHVHAHVYQDGPIIYQRLAEDGDRRQWRRSRAVESGG